MKKLCAVAGPTASGKTALAVELALRMNGEVVSFDSMQVYRDLSVGTAKPDMAERRGVPHHLFDLVSVNEDFSCADFCDAAEHVIADVTERGHLPILCGGTGLYLDSLLKGGGLSAAGASEELRSKYLHLAETEGVDAVHRILAEKDPDSAASIHPNNLKRVIRALEIFDLTGITKTEWDRRSRELERRYDDEVIVLTFENRDLLYGRIEYRVDVMLREGLESEARMLYESGVLSHGKGITQAIGYKEFIPYFKGERTLAEVRDDIVIATRRYAKRQITWFSRYGKTAALYADKNGEMRDLEDIADEAEMRIKKKI